MVKTGYISFITESGGGYDVNGNPVAATKTATDFIKCNLRVFTKEYRTLVDGQYLQGSYSCYIQQILLPETLVLSAVMKVQIQDNNAHPLGSFQIQNVEYLNLTQRVKLVV